MMSFANYTNMRLIDAKEHFRVTKNADKDCIIVVTGGFGAFNKSEKAHAKILESWFLNRGVPLSHLLSLSNTSNTAQELFRVSEVIECMKQTEVTLKYLTIVSFGFHAERVSSIASCLFQYCLCWVFSVEHGAQTPEHDYLLKHEQRAIELLNRQGGVIIGSTHYPFYSPCSSVSNSRHKEFF